MIKDMIKIALAAVVLGAASPAYALQFGEYAVTPFNEGQQNEAFNICIQPDNRWYISGSESGWKGKWAEFKSVSEKAYPGIHSDGKDKVYILQAIHPDEGRMRSVAINASEYSISGNYLKVSASSGLESGFEAKLTYKGSRCAPYQADTAQVKKASPKGSTDIREMPAVGPWKIMASFEHGPFDGCAGILMGADGAIMIGSEDNDHWRVAMAPVAGFQRGSTVKVTDQIGNTKPRTHDVSVNRDDGSISMDVDVPWIADFFDYSEGAPEGTVRDSYRIWLGNTERYWKIEDGPAALDAITACIEKYKPAARTASRQASPQPYYAPPAMPQYGNYTAIFIDRNIVQDVIAQGKDLYVKLPRGSNITVRKSDNNRANYSNWYRGGLVKSLGLSNSNRGKNKAGYTYRVNTSAKFIEYHVNGQMVLQLRRD